jgi:putative hemolysin
MYATNVNCAVRGAHCKLLKQAAGGPGDGGGVCILSAGRLIDRTAFARQRSHESPTFTNA